jgi:hypothetical protein
MRGFGQVPYREDAARLLIPSQSAVRLSSAKGYRPGLPVPKALSANDI